MSLTFSTGKVFLVPKVQHGFRVCVLSTSSCFVLKVLFPFLSRYLRTGNTEYDWKRREALTQIGRESVYPSSTTSSSSISGVCSGGGGTLRTLASLSANLKTSLSRSVNSSGGNDDGKTTSHGESEETEYDPSKDSFFTQENAFGSIENKGLGEPNRPVFIPEDEKSSEEEELTAPTNCCFSGCPNCVWIDYVDKLSKKYSDASMSRERVLKELETIDDENIKAYIMMELRMKKLI